MAVCRSALLGGLLLLAAAGSAPAQGNRFEIVAASMKPTLLPGDFVETEPYLPGAAPERGDLVVVVAIGPEAKDYVERIVGLPGDRVRMVGGVLTINGEAVARERLDDFLDESPVGRRLVQRWRETLPNGVSHDTLNIVENGPLDDTDELLVPEGHYFVLGDNRDASSDSRLAVGGLGFVPRANLFGTVSRL